MSVLRPLVDDIDTHCRIEGPQVDLPAQETLAMTMVLHELCTNALKHGLGVATRPDRYCLVGYREFIRSGSPPCLAGTQRPTCGRSHRQRRLRQPFDARAFGASGSVKLDYSGLASFAR